MPVINIKPSPNNSVDSEGSSSSGDSITNTTISGISFVSEELTKQINPGVTTFYTTHQFVQFSLEVFINGIKQSPGFDFNELDTKNGFSLISLTTNYPHWLNSNSCVLVKYIKA